MMKNISKSTLLFFCFIICSFIFVLPISGQTNIVKINAVKSNNYGVTYFLPKTGLNIEVEVSKIEKKAGQYAKYAERYLGISDVVFEDETYYTLDNVTVKTKGIPNKEEGYLIEFKQKTIAPFTLLTKEGLLCTINAEYESTESPFSGAIEKKKNIDEVKVNVQSIFTEEYLRAGSVSKMAEVAAKQIYRLRESRTDILTGDAENAPKDGEAMKLILNQSDAQEKALLELFTGTIKKEVLDAEFELIPSSDIQKEVIFRFSKHLGIVDAEDLSGVPVYLNLKNLEPIAVVDEKSKEKKEQNPKGVIYNLPGKASIEIYYGNKELCKENIQVVQFGTKQTLAPAIFEDKKNPVKIYFYPETGAVKQIVQ